MKTKINKEIIVNSDKSNYSFNNSMHKHRTNDNSNNNNNNNNDRSYNNI